MFDRLAELRAKRENGEGGFTLIELLVVVVIIGILIAIAIPLYLNYKKGAADDSAQSDVRSAVAAVEACQANGNAYPTTLTIPGDACTGQRVNKSGTNTVNYVATTTGSAYAIQAYNSGGNTSSTNWYCYSSKDGGAPKLSTKSFPAAADLAASGGWSC